MFRRTGSDRAVFRRTCTGCKHGIGSRRSRIPLGERNALLMRSVKSAFALLLTKVTKPAAERRKRVSINYRNFGGEAYKKNNQRYVR